jgi:hypothetical protein
LVKWKRTLRSEKERRTVERMEKESEEKMDLGDIMKVVENDQMWKIPEESQIRNTRTQQ